VGGHPPRHPTAPSCGNVNRPASTYPHVPSSSVLHAPSRGLQHVGIITKQFSLIGICIPLHRCCPQRLKPVLFARLMRHDWKSCPSRLSLRAHSGGSGKMRLPLRVAKVFRRGIGQGLGKADAFRVALLRAVRRRRGIAWVLRFAQDDRAEMWVHPVGPSG